MSTNAYEEEPYYHGLLPREDLPYLLKTPGDFLLRVSQPKVSEPRSIIISMAFACSRAVVVQEGEANTQVVRLNSNENIFENKGKPPKITRKGQRGLSKEGVPKKGSMRRRKNAEGQTQNSAELLGKKDKKDNHVTKDDGEEKFVAQKHFVVQLKASNDSGSQKVSIDGTTMFETVSELINDYKSKQRPLNVEQANTLIINPVPRAPWEMMHEQVTLGNKLGQGAFGDVMSGKLALQRDGETKEVDVAVKVAKSGEEMNKEKIKEVMKEARLMRNYDHPNVVKLYGVCVIKEPLMIVMELINGGGLDEYLKKNTVPLEEKLNMIQGAAWGIEYLHFKNCIHRDLAARNCLYATVNDEKIIKISDFGLSREGDKYCLTQVRMVPIKWLAPETIQTLVYTRKSDVWSFGVMVWEIYVNGEEPYVGLSNGETKTKVLNGGRLQFPEGAPGAIVDLVNKECWDVLPEKRSSMTVIGRKLEKLTGLPAPPQQLDVRKGGVTEEKEASRESRDSNEKEMKTNCNEKADNKPPHAGTPHGGTKRKQFQVNIPAASPHKGGAKEGKLKSAESGGKKGRKSNESGGKKGKHN